MNRRQFAYVTSFAGALAAGGQAAPASGAAGRLPDASGLITEMVFLDDCVRLAMYDGSLSAAAKSALTAHPDFVRNGALWPGGAGSGTAETFALAAGRVSSQALAHSRQPDSPEAKLYQDVAILRDLAAKAGRAPDQAAPIRDLLDILHVRRRLGLHTLNPDDNIHPWLEGIVAWWRDERDLRAALAAIYTAPDHAKMREFADGFYNPEDPLIRLARGFEFAEVAPADVLAPALAQAPSGSGYARALAGALAAMRKLHPPA